MPGSEDVFHALFLQFLVILWSIYTNIKRLFIDKWVVSSGPGGEHRALGAKHVLLGQVPRSGAEVWGKRSTCCAGGHEFSPPWLAPLVPSPLPHCMCRSMSFYGRGLS